MRSTAGMSRPRAATSVATRMSRDLVLNLLRAPSLADCESCLNVRSQCMCRMQFVHRGFIPMQGDGAEPEGTEKD
jgi:hypothetical protein